MNNNKMDINIPFIKKIVSIIVSSVDPEQIVLFGSYARGDNDNTSDYESWIDRAKSSLEIEDYNESIIIAEKCLKWIENKIEENKRE